MGSTASSLSVDCGTQASAITWKCGNNNPASKEDCFAGKPTLLTVVIIKDLLETSC